MKSGSRVEVAPYAGSDRSASSRGGGRKRSRMPALRATALVAVADALPDASVIASSPCSIARRFKSRPRTPSQFAPAPDGRSGRAMVRAGGKGKGQDALRRGTRLANQVANKTEHVPRGRFAARLARVDLPSALAIAKEFPASRATIPQRWVLWNIAFRLAADNPAEAERVLRQVPQETGRDWLPPAIAWKMAAVDPAVRRQVG